MLAGALLYSLSIYQIFVHLPFIVLNLFHLLFFSSQNLLFSLLTQTKNVCRHSCRVRIYRYVRWSTENTVRSTISISLSMCCLSERLYGMRIDQKLQSALHRPTTCVYTWCAKFLCDHRSYTGRNHISFKTLKGK